MKILIGTPSYRRPAMLAALIASLEVQLEMEAHDVRIFVADNDPDRREAAALCKNLAPSSQFTLTADIVATPGISSARNRLIEEARAQMADCLAMIDDDETASPGWLAALIEPIIERRANIVGGPVEYRFEIPPSPSLLRSGAFRTAKRDASGNLNATGNVCFDCHALAHHGWPQFDDAFGISGGEDKEFLTRLRKLGFSIGWAADAHVIEHVTADRLKPRAVWRRAFGIGASDFRIAARHGPLGETVTHLAKSSAVLATALPLAPLLLIPASRQWMLRRIARAAGRISAALGINYAQYGASVSP